MPNASIKRSPISILSGGRNSRMTQLLIGKEPGVPMETPDSLNVDAKKIGGVGKRKGKVKQGNNVVGSTFASQTTDNDDFWVMQGGLENSAETNDGDETITGVATLGGTILAKLGQRITIGGSDIDITQIAMYAIANNTEATISGMTLSINSDSSGSPGSTLATSANSFTAEGTTSLLRTFRFTSKVTLSASTDYWLVLTANASIGTTTGSSLTLFSGAETASGANLKALTQTFPSTIWTSQTGTLFYRLISEDAGGDDFFFAQQFLVGGSNGDISEITLDLALDGTGSLTYTALFYTDSADTPDAVVTNGTSTAQNPTASITPSSVTFSFPIAPTLTAATKFWIVIKFEDTNKRGTGYIGGDSSTGTLMRKSNDNTPSWITSDFPVIPIGDTNDRGVIVYSMEASGDSTTCQGLFDFLVESAGTFTQKVMAFFGGSLFFKDGSSYTAIATGLQAGQDVLADFYVANNLLITTDYANNANRFWNGVEQGTPANSTMAHGYRVTFAAAMAASNGTWSTTGWVRLLAVTTLLSGGFRASAEVDVDIDDVGKHINMNTIKADKAFGEFLFDVGDDATLWFMTTVVGVTGTTDTALLDRQLLYKIPDAAIANPDTGAATQPLADAVDNFDILTDTGLTSENILLDEYKKDQVYFTNQVATPKAKFLTGGFGYVVMGGDPDNTSRAWVSGLQQPQIWSVDGGVNGDFYEVGQENDGQELKAVYFWGGGFYAFKDRDIYFYSATGDTVIAFIPTKMKSNGMSCLSHFAIVETPAGLVFPTQTGMAIIRQGSEVVEPLDQEKIGDLFESGSSASFNLAAMNFSVAANNQNKRLAVFGVSSNTATTRDKVLVYDYELGSWWIRDGVAANYFASISDSDGLPEFWSGDYSGKVFRHDTGTNDDGSAINFTIESPFMIFGDPDQFKRVRRLAVKGEVQSSGTLTVEVYIDYDNSTIVQTVTFDMSDARFKAWLDVPLNIICRAIKYKFKNSELNVDVQLDGFVSHYQDIGLRK